MHLMLLAETIEARDGRARGVGVVVENAQAHAAAKRRLVQTNG
jgi:hypothetical protein